ncbi:uncharacterized protein N0V89_001697 [Didymosphaeria variabile]|uniref:Carrier domain-containing protein n=1 Tax=Didymosphaeria variabile TaxID=1932322 RepID=A0A9W9CG54_9PLEO|nr:uncharacterized protein N0V89_001697 [Didymosphaeria variabile]KAJ4361128.1 hypothetical protein N0V89_001697 [Didymosphaeria variabile]
MGEYIPSQWPYESMIGRVEAVASSNPNEVALKLPFGDKSMTYAEMLQKARGIASVLRSEGCTAGSIVAVYQEPTPNWLCSVLGVFGSGAVCVPFDAGTLVKRLADMADNSKAQYILVDSSNGTQATKQLNTDGTRKIINVEQVSASRPDKAQTADSLLLPKAEDPAMILYTSGSTGVPKGIVLKHGGFRNWAEFVPPLFRSGGRDTVLQQSSSGFDMAYLQAFFALAYGGTVCIVPRAMRVDAHAITQIIASEGVTVTQGVPSEYSNWLRYGESESLADSIHWKTAMCGGEPGTNIVLELQAALGPQPRPRFFHMYGPTEITFITTAMELFYGDDEKTPAVGGPFPNYSVYVLDDQLRPVPPGVQGEIYIGGAGVASGYLGNAVLTEEKFLPDPFAPASFKSHGWTTMHRTGDNGRWRKGGGLLIEGRRSGDTQHKLRGLRVDLQEVENVMLKESNGLLTDVVVSVTRTSPQSPEFLVAHVRFDPNHCPTENDQQHVLSELSSNLPLPQYMWPAVAIAVQELPMMSSGKLDRRAVASLPLPELPNFNEIDDDEKTADALLTETEARLKKMWEDIISKDVSKRHRIRPDTDFFHVGGTSMLLLRLQSQIQKSFGFDFPFAEMFEASTLGAMSKRIDDKRGSESECFDWEMETAVPVSLMSALKNATHPLSAPTKVVVLTGATGLLGQGFLQALIDDANVDKIHCVALRNMRTRVSSLPLLVHPKVVPHEGDLALPRLGLDEATATLIFQEANRIIHNGADTSHLKTYRSLRAVNLHATQEIVLMCLLAGKMTPIHYVSTASILQYSGLSEFDEESAAHYPPPSDAFDGYSASKWASERYLEKIHQHSDGKWPIWIHRPTSVQRGASTSRAETNNLDVVSNLLEYCKLANAVPVSPNLRGFINLTRLDDVVASMMAEIHVTIPHNQEYCPVRYLHERGDIDIPFDDIKSFIDAATGRDAEKLALHEWARRVAKLGMDSVLVAYFETVCRAPPVVWQRLLKKSDLGE